MTRGERESDEEVSQGADSDCIHEELGCLVKPWRCQADPADPQQGEDTTENDDIRTDRESCE